MTIKIHPTICAALKALPVRYEPVTVGKRQSQFDPYGFPCTIRQYTASNGVTFAKANRDIYRWTKQGKIRIAGATWTGRGNVLANVYEVCV